jgi:uncharacterized C2H2 Zn-finger protein
MKGFPYLDTDVSEVNVLEEEPEEALDEPADEPELKAGLFQAGRPRTWKNNVVSVQTISGAFISVPMWFTDDKRRFKTGAPPLPLPKAHKESSEPSKSNTTTSATGEKPVQCTFANCEKRFADESSMKKHYSLAHELKSLSCRIQGCNMKFNDRLSLTRHQNSVHGTNKKNAA